LSEILLLRQREKDIKG